ncbi:PadR family transcriptional regulator [Parapedobacter koreensis]|uniref:PadR family transcriptional regulator n=1 Tax=Parapedobacter koreensis TaxID=332977 RepID=UPI000B8697D8|nr:PadR family transcriptional regulator [Parapedobacter koreensis]
MNEDFVHKWRSQVKKGTLAFIVLNILKTRELYGYELIEQIRSYTAIDVAEGTLYPLLNRLKDEGLVNAKWVEQETGIPRKYYSLNEKGLASLAQMTQFWEELQKSINKLSK